MPSGVVAERATVIAEIGDGGQPGAVKCGMLVLAAIGACVVEPGVGLDLWAWLVRSRVRVHPLGRAQGLAVRRVLTMRPREIVQVIGVLAGVGVVAHSLLSWGAWIAVVLVLGLTGGGLLHWTVARRRHPETGDQLLGYLLLAVIGFVAITEFSAVPARARPAQATAR
ncbi:MAG: hypothetical protein R6X02_03380 [Enhygromyxa sp.]